MAVLITAAGGCATQSVHSSETGIVSGLHAGADIVPWNPIHVAGPNAGTNACPVCTYEARPAVVIFVKDGPDVARLAGELENLVMREQGRQLKGFVIVLDSTPKRLQRLGVDLKLSHIGLCYPDPATAPQDLAAYQINSEAQNTVMIYKNYKVTSNFTNLSADKFDRVAAAVSQIP